MKDARHETMDAFLDRAGWRASRREPLPGDASTRRYIRLRQGERTALLMDQPQAAETAVAPADATPEQRAALGYNAVARLAGADVARFVAAAKYLRQQGLAAPDIYDADVANGFLLIEDLGDAIYADVLAEGADEQALYAAAIEALVQLHGAVAPLRIAPDTPLYVYDETALLAEIDLLTQ